MELLVNDLSIHGQFHNLSDFHAAIRRVMGIRKMAQRHGRELHCHRRLSTAQVAPKTPLPQAIQHLTRDERRSVMSWLTQHGPFWDDDDRRHSPDEYLECNGTIVTDTAAGEAAYRCLAGPETSLVSLIPSSWNFSPAVVKWWRSDEEAETVKVVNYRDADTLKAALDAAPVPIMSWAMLADMLEARCTRLTFFSDCFEHLEGHPFVRKAAQDILIRLQTLDHFKTCVDAEGNRTSKGHRLCKEYFAGEGAWFSDSSDTEKQDFRTELTFYHPACPGKPFFCPWHGKVNSRPPLRIHFSWPVTADGLLYVVYVGPEITRR